MVKRVLMGVSAVLLLVALVPLGTTVASTAHHIAAGQRWSDVLVRAKSGDTVIVGNGVHPRQTVTQQFAGVVTIIGETRDGAVVQGLNVTGGASNLHFRDLTFTTAGPGDAQSAIKVYGGSREITFERTTISPRSHAGLEIHNYGGAPRAIRLVNSRVTGAQSSATTTGRNVWIGDLNGGDHTTWPSDILVAGNDLGHASADAVHISGGTRVAIVGNEIHSIQENSDHNDGVQSVASYELRIIGNRISSPAPWSCATCVPPDQGIIVGHAYPATVNKKVVRTLIANNIVHHWRGKGLMTTGTRDTLVVNNTVTHLGPAGSTAAASMTVAEPYGYKNENLRIWNNIFDRLATSGTTPIAYLGHNCIQQGGMGEALVTAVPRFAETTREFTLAPDSPCRGAGVTRAEWATVTSDFAGLPFDSPPSVGARQSGGTPPEPEPEPLPIEVEAGAGVVPRVPTASPDLAVEPEPRPDPVADQLEVASFSGNFGAKGGSHSYVISTGAGELVATLGLRRGTSATVTLATSEGGVVHTGVLQDDQALVRPVEPGSYRVVISTAERASYDLSVARPKG